MRAQVSPSIWHLQDRLHWPFTNLDGNKLTGARLLIQVLCDGKNFDVAIQDYNKALSLTPEADQVGRARLLAGRLFFLPHWPALWTSWNFLDRVTLNFWRGCVDQAPRITHAQCSCHLLPRSYSHGTRPENWAYCTNQRFPLHIKLQATLAEDRRLRKTHGLMDDGFLWIPSALRAPKSALIGRALAYEGEGLWEEAKTDYTVALDLAAEGGWVWNPSKRPARSWGKARLILVWSCSPAWAAWHKACTHATRLRKALCPAEFICFLKASLIHFAWRSSSPDPYVINSRGNCYNSLGMWRGALWDIPHNVIWIPTKMEKERWEICSVVLLWMCPLLRLLISMFLMSELVII